MDKAYFGVYPSPKFICGWQYTEAVFRIAEIERHAIVAGWKERDEAAVVAAAQVECSAEPPGDDPPSDIFIR
jgi:hypothetical protein